jgi:hypothetical protein
MHIYHARRDPHATGIDHDLAAGVEARTDGNDPAAIHDNIGIVETFARSRQDRRAFKNRRLGRQGFIAARVRRGAIVIGALFAGGQQKNGR